jgi:phage-related protein
VALPPINLLSVVSNIERHKIASGEPWVLLMDIQWPGDQNPTAAQQHLRLIRDVSPMTFDAGDGNGPQVYTPFNFEFGELAMSSNGSVPDTEVKASNVMRVLQMVIEQYAGVVGANLTLYAVNAANPDGEPDLTVSFIIKQSVCNAKQVTFKLGMSSPLRRLFPIHKYYPNYCIWQYNSPAMQAANDPRGQQCGYVGPMTSCSHTIDGPTGCVAHNNLVRIGAFPGIDTNGAAVAGVV